MLVGGLGASHLAFKGDAVPFYTAAGYRCLVFDNRDAGKTGESPLPAYTVRQMADDAAGLVRQLGLPPAHFLGVSMGGMIVQEIALNYPELVRSLTLVGAMARIEPYNRHGINALQAIRRGCTLEEFYEQLGLWLFTYRFYQQPGAAALYMQYALDDPLPQSDASFFRQCQAMLSHDTLDRLGGITAPTHVIVGAEDILAVPRHSRLLAECIPGAQLTVIPEAAHSIVEEQPHAFSQSVLSFLAAH